MLSKLSAHGRPAKHFKIRELERRPSDLSFTQESQARGFLAPPQLSAGCRSCDLGIRTVLVASGLRLERDARAWRAGRGCRANSAGAAVPGRANRLRSGARGTYPPYDS